MRQFTESGRKTEKSVFLLFRENRQNIHILSVIGNIVLVILGIQIVILY